MNQMEQDLRSLGLHLWPDDAPLRPHADGRRSPARMPSGLGAVALGLATFVMLFGVIALSLVVAHTRTSPSHTTASAAPQAQVVRIDIAVPRNPVTFEVARGTILALHLHLTGGTPRSAWSAGGPEGGAGIDFQPVEVPYPGPHPASSETDFYVAFRISSTGSTQIAIGLPDICPNAVPCFPGNELIYVRAVTPPIRTATITGELANCALSTVGTTSCLKPEAGATIRFRSSHDQTIGATTDVFGDYAVELPPGTWTVSTTPPSLPGQTSTLIVGAGGIVIDDVKVVPLRPDTGAIVGGIYRCFGLPPSISGPPTRVAGIVDVYVGNGIATYTPKLTQQSVATGGQYVFDLAPGAYTLIGHWAGSNLAPPIASVTVTSGTITTRNLDYEGCI